MRIRHVDIENQFKESLLKLGSATEDFPAEIYKEKHHIQVECFPPMVWSSYKSIGFVASDSRLRFSTRIDANK